MTHGLYLQFSRCKALKDYMKQVGEVNYVSCNEHILNVGIVEFNRSSHIRKAIEMLDNTEFCGHKIRLIDPKSYVDVGDRDNKNNDNGKSRRQHSPRGDDDHDEEGQNASLRSVDRYSKSPSQSSRSRSMSQDSRKSLRSRSPAAQSKNGNDDDDRDEIVVRKRSRTSGNRDHSGASSGADNRSSGGNSGDDEIPNKQSKYDSGERRQSNSRSLSRSVERSA